jgi:hypothetical protein
MVDHEVVIPGRREAASPESRMWATLVVARSAMPFRCHHPRKRMIQ